MGSYYYLMAQLPHLNFEQKPPMSSEAFKALAKNLMSKTDSDLLDKLSLLEGSLKAEGAEAPCILDEPKKTGCKFIDSWYEWERAFRLNAAKHRASNIKRDSSSNNVEPPFVPQDAATAAARAAGGECNPLESEILIDKARWNAIDELAGNDYFTRNHAYAYLLKLLILERRASHDEEKGFSEYKSVYEEILKNANESLGDSI